MEETKHCRACDKTKSVTEFYKSGGATKDGFQTRCKRCVGLKKLIPKDKKEKSGGSNKGFSFDDKNDYKIVAPKKEEYMLMYKLIEIIGYRPDNAHKDFCKRWGLKEKYKQVRCQPVYLSNGEKNPLFKQTWFPKK